MNSAMRIYGVLGYPLGHSLSPALHNAVFATTRWPGAYTVFALLPERLEDFVRAVRLLPIHGVSVTIPYKETLCALVDRLTPRAHAVGAVNTLYFEGDIVCGDNTDVAGFIAPLHGMSIGTALVLGAGGAARAVVAGLQELHAHRIVVTSRDIRKARTLARDLGVHALDWSDRTDVDAELIVNATPCGMQGLAEDSTPFPAQGFARSSGMAYDLIYAPRQTRFLQDAHAAGWNTQNGLTMFIHQALEQQRLWTGNAPSPAIENMVRDLLENITHTAGYCAPAHSALRRE